MNYLKLCELYEKISSTSKRLEKVEIISKFLSGLKEENSRFIYLLMGKVFADYEQKNFGISGQILLKTISVSFGITLDEAIKKFKELGDLGDVAEFFVKKKRQSFLFQKDLTTEKVFENLEKLSSMEGKGVIDKKIALLSELFSIAKPIEAKYLSRAILENLRIGISSPTIVDALSKTFFDGENKEIIQEKYDLTNDFVEIFQACKKGEESLREISIVPGKPLNVMLAVKVNDIAEAFEVCGKPAAIEQKYDGFRMLINKDKEGKIRLFTRKLEDVTLQFPDVVERVENNVKGKSFILDSEITGFDKKTKKYLPFESISQRIRRKYEIERLIEELPVEINVFDCLSLNGKDLTKISFMERRKIVEKIVKKETLKIRPAVQIITDKEEEANKFFEEALKLGEEGIMIKSLDSPYKQGRRVGYMCKLKPEANDLDLVITGAEYGTGKRSGALTSFFVACRDGEDLLEIGRVSSGLKEKEEEGLTYEQITKLLEPLIESEKDNIVRLTPKVVIMVTYQNIQPSTAYSSGFALRFPRIVRYRPDKSWKDISSIDEIRKEVLKSRAKL
jgi:DNA ligase 1